MAGTSAAFGAGAGARAGLSSRLAVVKTALTPGEWRRLGGMTAVVIALHVVGWALLVLAVAGAAHFSKGGAFGVGTGVLAYTLGMRHAFDADHIAAIDNTTRK